MEGRKDGRMEDSREGKKDWKRLNHISLNLNYIHCRKEG
jgi:hypothetical protein